MTDKKVRKCKKNTCRIIKFLQLQDNQISENKNHMQSEMSSPFTFPLHTATEYRISYSTTPPPFPSHTPHQKSYSFWQFLNTEINVE